MRVFVAEVTSVCNYYVLQTYDFPPGAAWDLLGQKGNHQLGWFYKTPFSPWDLGTDLSSANNEHIQQSEYLCTLEHCNILKHLMISQILTY